MPAKKKSARASAAAALPRRLQKPAEAIQVLGADDAERLLLSRSSGEALARGSLAALYDLAVSLRSPQMPFHAKHLLTDPTQHITLEQIWGQMTVLLRPVLRRVQDNVRRTQRRLEGSSAKPNHRTAPTTAPAPSHTVASSESDAASDNVSDLDEGVLDELGARVGQSGPTSRPAAQKTEDWRYAFGKSTAEDDAEDWGEVAADADRASDHADNDDDAREALRMMYGDDFEDDGKADLIGADDDPDLEDDIELDDPANEETTQQYTPQDGLFYGTDNLLDEQDEKDAAQDDDDNAAEDAALEQALRDPTLTELQRTQLRERHAIAKMEERRLYTTDWAMAGETAAHKRPREALLNAEQLEFDYGMKAVPVITEAVTARLEDRIRHRILEKQYDDVARRVAPTTAADLVTTKRGDAAMEGEKSKLSLMDLYEKEYTERVRKAEEEAAGGSAAAATVEPLTEIEKDELRAIQLWRRLAQHLDALSNFYYTPKPVQQDLEARVRVVEGQAPAIALETVGHFATTRETALAPQDVYRPSSRRFAVVGSAEMTPQERRALRRSRKDDAQRVKNIKEVHQQRRAKQRKQQEASATA